MKLRFGLVGLGSMGINHHRIARNHPDIAVTAICDTAGGDGCPEPLFRDLDAMISSAALDAVILCVPTHLHHSMALKCIDRGLPVLIEKPLASTAAQGRELLARVESAGARIAVGHVERFNPVVNALIRELEGKDLFSIQITRVGPFPPRISDVGVLTDLSVHDIDLIRYISKREILASRIFKSRKVADHYEDNAILSFFLEREVVAGITTNWLTPFKKRSIEVATAEAYYEANLMTQQLIAYSAFKIDNSFIQRECRVQKVEPLAREIDAFVHFVRTGEHGELATAADGLRPLELIESNAKDP